jgi:hypothetical protein
MAHSDPWRDAINIEYGFSRPDVPVKLAAEIRDQYHPDQTNRQAVIDTCTDYVVSRFEDVRSRDDVASVLNELSDLGISVAGQSAKYITVSADGLDKNIRLKGAIYETESYDDSGFKYGSDREDTLEYRNSEQEYRAVCSAADETRQTRAEAHRERFGTSGGDGDTLFKPEACPEINSRKTEADASRHQGASQSEQGASSSTGQAQSASRNSAHSHSSSGGPSADNDGRTALITQGHEHETAFEYGKRKQAEFDFFKRKQEKELRRAKQHMTLLRKIQNEAKQFIEQLNTTYRGLAEHFIPSTLGLVQHNNRAIEQHRSQASRAGGEDGGSSFSSGGIGGIASSTAARIDALESGCGGDVRGAGCSLVAKLKARRDKALDDTPTLKP